MNFKLVFLTLILGIIPSVSVLADQSKAIIFCVSEPEPSSDFQQMCGGYSKLKGSVYKEVDIVRVPESLRYESKKLKEFICKAYEKVPEITRLVTLFSAHGEARGTEKYYEKADKELGREVRGKVQLFLGNKEELKSEKGLNVELLSEMVNQCLSEKKLKSVLVLDACHSGAACKAVSDPKSQVNLDRLGILATCLDCTITNFDTFIELLLKQKKKCVDLDKNKDGVVSAQEFTDFIHLERKFGAYNKTPKEGEEGNLKSVTRPSRWSSGATIPLYAGDSSTKYLFSCPESYELKEKNSKEPAPQHYNSDDYRYHPFRGEKKDPDKK